MDTTLTSTRPAALGLPAGPTHRLTAAWRALPTGASAVSIAVVGQTVANIAFHGVVGRTLSTASYGALGTLLGLMIMLTVPLGSLQAALNRAVAIQPGRNPGRALGRVALGSIAVAGVVALAAAPLQSFLHLPSLWLALLLAPYVAVAAVLAAARGVLLGAGRGTAVAVTMGLATVLRLVAGAVLTPRYGVTGAMWATVGSEAVGLVAVLALALPAVGRGGAPLELTRRDLGDAGAAIAGLWLLTSVDLLLARHALPATEAGGYVAASTLARCAMALPTALVMVAMPRFATPFRDEARKAVEDTLRVVVAVAVAGALPLIVAPGLIQQALFGGQPAPHALIRTLASIAVLSAMATVLTYFHLARSTRAKLIPWAFAAVEAALIATHHSDARAIALGSALATVPAVAALAWTAAAAIRLSPVPAAPALGIGGLGGPGSGPDLDPEPDPDPASTRLWEPADPTIDLTVVVPFYNPGPSVGTTIDRALEVLRADGLGFEIIAVSDGATDGSEVHVPVHEPEVTLIVSPANEGKGAAVQRGLRAARGRAVGFVDADGDIDPAHLVRYVHRLREGGHDLVFASKRHGASATESSAARRVISVTYSTLVSGLFRLGVNDTQTGCKVLSRDLAAAVLPWAQERRFAFDLELFVLARRLGFTALEPAPVHLGERLAGSTVTRAAVLRTLRDTLTIWQRLHLGGAYPARATRTVARPAVARPTVLAPVAQPAPARVVAAVAQPTPVLQAA